MSIIVNYILPVLSLLVLLFCSAFFSSSETAFYSLSYIKLRQMQTERRPGASRVARLKADMNLFITTVLVGTNFVHTLASALATALALRIAGPQTVVYATLIMTMLLITFGEILPKTVAALKPEMVAAQWSLPLTVFQKLAYPVIWIFLQFTRFVEYIERSFVLKTHPIVTELELKTLIDVGEQEGTLELSEKAMLHKIFEFTDLTVRDIMRHRSLIKSVDANFTYRQVVSVFAETGYSRLPVYDGDTENLIGMLHYKSVIFNRKRRPDESGFARRCMSQIMFVPETISAVELLQKFKAEHKNIAVAVNEHGTNSGVVTMDDLLRCVFGHVIDEADVSPEQRITIVSQNEFLVPGDLRLEDVNSALNLHLQSQDYDTLGGWLMEKFDALPSSGEVLRFDGTIFIVEDQSARRVQTVRIKLG